MFNSVASFLSLPFHIFSQFEFKVMKVEPEEVTTPYYQSVMTWLDAPITKLVSKRSSIPTSYSAGVSTKIDFSPLEIENAPLNMLDLLRSLRNWRIR